MRKGAILLASPRRVGMMVHVLYTLVLSAQDLNERPAKRPPSDEPLCVRLLKSGTITSMPYCEVVRATLDRAGGDSTWDSSTLRWKGPRGACDRSVSLQWSQIECVSGVGVPTVVVCAVTGLLAARTITYVSSGVMSLSTNYCSQNVSIGV